MKTSYFGRMKTMSLAERGMCVAISRGCPVWYKGKRLLELAPTRAMLRMAPAEYDGNYADILAALDPKMIAATLGQDAILLCWEKPGLPCHRHTVADWLQHHTGIEVVEL